MQNSISYWQHFLLQETEEKELSPKQQKIAKLDPPADKIDAGDFKKLRAGSKIEEDYEEYDDDDFAEFSYLADTLENAKIISNYIQSKFEKLGISTDIDSVIGPGPFKIIMYDAEEKVVSRIIKIINKAVSDKTITDFSDEEIQKIISLNSSKPKLKKEGKDHEVSMANNSLETIIKNVMDLKSKLGNEEKDIPAWIQDHITNAANFISQAAENYHEYGEEDGAEEKTDAEVDDMSLEDLMEKIIKTKK